MDLPTILATARPILLKLLVGGITMAIIKLSPKLGLTLSPDEVKAIAGLGAATIIGMGMNWAAKTHATISNALPASTEDPKPSGTATPNT